MDIDQARHDDPILLDALMDAAVDAIVLTDEAGRILRANRAAADLFQHRLPDMIGQDFAILMPSAKDDTHPAFMAQHMSSGRRTILGPAQTIEGKRADGKRFPLLLSVGRAEIAQRILFVSILHDQTERLAMEAAAMRSQRMDAIGRMTGGISHDFNNLLTVIIGNLELLASADLTERDRQLLDDALSAADLGADLTSRLMAFARHSQLSAEPVDLNRQIEQSLALLRHTIGSHCEISSVTQPDLWLVAADATQLQTALLNLAMNAQDAMPGGGLLRLETQNIAIDDRYLAQELGVTPGRYVRLSVSDTGHGMTPEERNHALEPFFTTKPAGLGTGLGLSMVYGFVKQSGGHLTIYSELGSGTLVAMYFPALDADAALSEGAGRSQARPRAIPKTHRVLIVEDDAKLRRLTRTRLVALGYDCLMAGTADDAWEVLASGADVSLVFSDMVMPGKMSGYDLALRVARERPDIAILLTSGFSESVLQDRFVGQEFRILRKPYRQADLEAAIYAAMNGP